MNQQSGKKGSLEVATVAAGCFWCTEAAFTIIRGVKRIETGYTGGVVPNPTYADVLTGQTGHVEAAQIFYDPKVISYREILEIFFAMHEPTSLNRQGADVGTQYRSAIFYHDEQQKQTAITLIDELNHEGIWERPIVTSIEPLKHFYKAETYHKDYYKIHPREPYCQVVIAPKVAKLRSRFVDKIKVLAYYGSRNRDKQR
ncbi:MAG: peptide-methionine (S)-S-oxide reductase MsrA [Candidatus Bathyarchaeia archaeon]